MTYTGTVKNGVIVLDDNISLADGVAVEVAVVSQQDGRAESLREGLRKLAGTAKGLPADMARNHDHYIHGARKR